MAGGEVRELSGRIRSMKSTKKITHAMELIAGSRIVKAQNRLRDAIPYSDQITEVVRDLAAVGAGDDFEILVGRAEDRKTCYVVIGADRGLCGGYNAGVERGAEGEIKADVLQGREYELVSVGKKVNDYFRFREYSIDASFQGFSGAPTYEDARAIAEHVLEMFESEQVDRVEMVYTRFVSPGRQEVVLRPLVPLSAETVEGGDGLPSDGSNTEYEFEPDPTTIFELLLPRYVVARVYAALLNASASEHAFRQRAMKAATDNAQELIKSLSIVMNRARQAAITTEIMEIVGGAEALSHVVKAEVSTADLDDTGFGEFEDAVLYLPNKKRPAPGTAGQLSAEEGGVATIAPPPDHNQR